jgi:uncharacterized protein with GYD domain
MAVSSQYDGAGGGVSPQGGDRARRELTIASAGNIRSTTMRAWDADEFEGLVKLIG